MVKTGSRQKVYFLNLDVLKMMAGVELSSLKRTKIFCDYLELDTSFLTIGFNNRFSDCVSQAKLSNRCSQRLVAESMYDYILNIDVSSGEKISREDLYSAKVIEDENNNTDVRLYDELGRFFAFGKGHEDGALSFANYFENKRICRRETYDSRGFVVRSEIIHPRDENSETLVDIFHRPNGSPALIKQGTIEKNVARIDAVQLIDDKNKLVKVFKNDADLVVHWLTKKAEENDRTIFIVDRPNELFLPALAVKNKMPDKVKLVSVIHGIHTGTPDILSSETNGWYKTTLENLDLCDAVIVLTEQQKKNIEARYVSAAGKIHVIPHAVPKKEMVLKSGKRRRKKVVYVARFSPEKRHVLAVEMFSEVLKSEPGAELHFYGFGKTEDDVKEKIESLKLSNKVFLHPYSDDVDGIYADAALSILTSDTEGFCMGVLESLSCGCPVISFDIKYGPGAMIENGANGFLVKPGDVPGFSQRVVEVLKNDELHNQLVENAPNSVKPYYEKEVANKWGALVENI